MPYTTADRFRLFIAGKRDDISQADCYMEGVIVERNPEVALMLFTNGRRTPISLGLILK